MADLAELVRVLLLEAAELDAYATETRRQAGRLLLEAGCRDSRVAFNLAMQIRVDVRLVELLVGMAVAADRRAASRPLPAAPAQH